MARNFYLFQTNTSVDGLVIYPTVLHGTCYHGIPWPTGTELLVVTNNHGYVMCNHDYVMFNHVYLTCYHGYVI